MSIWHLLRYALTLSPPVVAGRAARVVRRKALALVLQRVHAGRRPYPPLDQIGPEEEPSLLVSPVRLVLGGSPALFARCRHAQAHRFDLLGSGWVEVRYADSPARERLVARLPSGARVQAAALWRLVDASYVPIDWHVDVKSGVRWPEGRWKDGIRYGHAKGVDVKMPWELARLQHLPMMAVAQSLAGGGEGKALRREIRNQILDFLASNPPGFGVNWACTMDVAIRAANICLAVDLVRVKGGSDAFDEAFLAWVRAGMLAHGRFIARNLEWSPNHRGNHYLADMVGLLFVAAWLPATPESNGWLSLAAREVKAEILRQFDEEGANFEASTCYHRLSSEMALYAAALILGLPESRLSGEDRLLPEGVVVRLSRMATFTRDVTKPDGHVVQIGDNDDGRFFKLLPAGTPGDPMEEDSLDHRALAGVAAAVFDDPDLAQFSGEGGALDRALAAALARGWYLAPPARPPAPWRAEPGRPFPGACLWSRRLDIVPPDPAVLKGLAFVGYADFGLYVWRNERMFLSIRCGPIGQNGNGGHAHNDQLAIELQIDGVDWALDPGTGVYTADLALRDRYRATAAHCTPHPVAREQGRLDLGPFRLGDQARARCYWADGDGFHGVHWGFGPPTYRRLAFTAEEITLRDGFGAEAPASAEDALTLRIASAAEMARLTPEKPPFSPGYGKVRRLFLSES